MKGRKEVMECFNVMLKHEKYSGCNQFKLYLDMGGHNLWHCISDNVINVLVIRSYKLITIFFASLHRIMIIHFD